MFVVLMGMLLKGKIAKKYSTKKKGKKVEKLQMKSFDLVS